MSRKPWQKPNERSALLMAKWLFTESKPGENNPKPISPATFEISSSKHSEDCPNKENGGNVTTACDRNELENGDEAVEVNPVEMVECWYSDDGDTADDENANEGTAFTGRLRGHRYRKRKRPKKSKLGRLEIVLKARNTII